MSANPWVEKWLDAPYKEGFYSGDLTQSFPPGLSEEVIVRLSTLKEEPLWLREFRLKAFAAWQKMTPPTWADLKTPQIDFQSISYHTVPKKLGSLEEVDPKILETFEKLGIPLHERAALAGVAVDAVLDSTSVATTFKDRLEKAGVIFCSFTQAAKQYPDLLKEHLATVVPIEDNFYAALNSAVFSDGSFVYIPKGVHCPMELSTYFRINARNTGQFERTLIVAEEDSYVSYLEGCSAVARSEQQLHAAVVEIVVKKNAQVKYATVQNWYPGDEKGQGGILNYVTKRALCAGENARVSWTQVETGSAITWKYPSVILKGDGSVGEFYSVALSAKYQQADTGTKMIHLGKNTSSTIISKGISAQYGRNSYRGLVRIGPNAQGAKNSTKCDSLLIGDTCEANTYPLIQTLRDDALVEHEASSSSISEAQKKYLLSRGIGEEELMGLIVAGFCKDVIRQLPMEFAVEAQKLLGVSLEGAVG